jgi:hypothetical protein
MKRFPALLPPQTRHNLPRSAVAGGRGPVPAVDKCGKALCELSRVELTMIKMFLTVTVSFAPTSQ